MEETCILSQRLVKRKDDSSIPGKVAFAILFDSFAGDGQRVGMGELVIFDELGDDSYWSSAKVSIYCALSTYREDHQLCDTPP